MGRLTLLLLAAFAAVNPQLRARVAPHAERALAPVYEWSAGYRVGEIARTLEMDAARGRPLPAEGGLEQHLGFHYAGTHQRLDPWGRPYFLRSSRWEARVGSAGRDRVEGTRDDLLSPPLRLP